MISASIFVSRKLPRFIKSHFKINAMKKLVLYLGMSILSMGIFTSSLFAVKLGTTAAGAKIIVPMSLTQTSALHFGTINEISATAGTIVLPSNSTTRVFTGGFEASTVAPLATNAAYNVTGTAVSTYALTLPPSTVVTNTTGTGTMTITLLTARFNGEATDAVVSTLSATGTDSFTLGGTLSAIGVQTGGAYAGSFDVSVDYN